MNNFSSISIILIIFFSFGCNEKNAKDLDSISEDGLKFLVNFYNMRGDYYSYDFLQEKEILFIISYCYLCKSDFGPEKDSIMSILIMRDNRDSFHLYIDMETKEVGFSTKFNSRKIENAGYNPFFSRHYRKIERKEYDYLNGFFKDQLTVIKNPDSDELSIKQGYNTIMLIYDGQKVCQWYAVDDTFKHFIFTHFNLYPEMD